MFEGPVQVPELAKSQLLKPLIMLLQSAKLHREALFELSNHTLAE